jgi:DNA-binding response OmpR family regulator
VSDRRLILVADDDEDILVLVETVLDRAGYDVVTTRDGVQALAAAMERPPDLAVLDVAMPELDGLEVLRRLRAHANTHDVPVLLLSARVQEDDVKLGFDTGADGYVQKPFSPRELCERVDALLDGQAGL